VVRLEVVVVGVELDGDAVGQHGDGLDDVDNDLANGAVDEGEVCDVGGAGEVELDDGWVDKGYLRGSDLQNVQRRLGNTRG
jgi:hypothetical protein